MSFSESNLASTTGHASKADVTRTKAGAPVRLIRAGNEDITIGENSVLEGSFETQGAMFVDGAAVNVDLHAAQLSIGATGRVDGQASVVRAEIAGAFDGVLECSGEVILRSSSRIAGELRCAKLVTHRGAVIDAQVRVVSDGEDQQEEKSSFGAAISQNARGANVRPWTRRHLRRLVPAIGGAAVSLCFVAAGALIF